MFLTQEMINVWGDGDINHADVTIRNNYACIKISHCSPKMCKIVCQKLKCVFKRGKYTIRKEDVLKENLWTWDGMCNRELLGDRESWLSWLCKGAHCYLGVSIDEDTRYCPKPRRTSASGNVPFKGWASNWSKHYCTAISSELKYTLLGVGDLIKLGKLMKLQRCRKLKKILKPLTIVTVQAGSTIWGEEMLLQQS